jgi:hypothetical protein
VWGPGSRFHGNDRRLVRYAIPNDTTAHSSPAWPSLHPIIIIAKQILLLIWKVRSTFFYNLSWVSNKISDEQCGWGSRP